LPSPAYSFGIDDPLDVVAISVFLITSIVIARLVSQLQMAKEEALSSVNRRLVDSEEKERARIARELHDDIDQRLALLVNKLQPLRQNSSGWPAEVCDSIAELYAETVEIATDIQALSHELHSSKLELLGLDRAMKSFCNEFGQRQKCEIDFRSYGLSSSLPLNMSVSFFRVLQQSLRNVATHSGAPTFKVELFGKTDAIHLMVRDSGLGFDPTAAMEGTGLGLVSMRERMKLVNRTFSIASQAQAGHASVPRPPRS
jgi:signal transduction histidine kinase